MTTSISIHRSSSPVFEELTAVICRLAGNVHTDERLRCGALVSLSYLAVSSEHSFIACEKAIKIHKDETQNKNTHATRTTIRQARTETKRGSMGRKGQSDQTHATHDKQPQNDKTRKNIQERHSTAPENRTRMDHHHRKQGQRTPRATTRHEQRTETSKTIRAGRNEENTEKTTKRRRPRRPTVATDTRATRSAINKTCKPKRPIRRGHALKTTDKDKDHLGSKRRPGNQDQEEEGTTRQPRNVQKIITKAIGERER
jgi:hypothetical protein